MSNPRTVIIVLSRYQDFFDRVRRTVEMFEPYEEWMLVVDGAFAAKGWKMVRGKEPYTHAGNVNLGIEAAGSRDVLLLDDDVELLMPNSVRVLRELAYSDPAIGIIAPQVEGRCGNHLMRSTTKLLSPIMLSSQAMPGFCLYIKRAVIEQIGLLPESEQVGNDSDAKFTRMAQEAGWKLAVTPLVRVKHGVEGGPRPTYGRRQCGEV
jgi:GT2 family glycosyltransferase